MAQDLDPAPVLEDIRELAAEARVVVKEVGRAKLDAAARTDAPQGVIAFAKPLPEAELDDLIVRRKGKPAPFLLCSDGITDPGNLGALLRSAECAGVTGVVLPQHRAVHITPTVTKAAAGAIEHLPMATVGGLPTAIKTMRDAGIWVVGLDERAEKTLWDLTMDDAPVALVLGAEGPGLSRLVRERCDELVSIPMRGRVASLNVGHGRHARLLRDRPSPAPAVTAVVDTEPVDAGEDVDDLAGSDATPPAPHKLRFFGRPSFGGAVVGLIFWWRSLYPDA